MTSEPSAPDLNRDAGVHVHGLQKAFSVAAPAPIAWEFVCQQYASGRWKLLANGRSAALITHTGVAGHKSTSILAMAGELGDCRPLVEQIEQEAAAAGSTLVVFIGRRGWVREFPEYLEKGVIGAKELPCQAL